MSLPISRYVWFDGKYVSISGNVMIGKGTIIKKGSKVIGPIIIGKECIIGPDTHIGPNTSIGDNSKLAKCDIKNSIIMPGCNIDGNFKIRDSIIAY